MNRTEHDQDKHSSTEHDQDQPGYWLTPWDAAEFLDCIVLFHNLSKMENQKWTHSLADHMAMEQHEHENTKWSDIDHSGSWGLSGVDLTDH